MGFRRWGCEHPANQLRDEVERVWTGFMNNPGVHQAAQVVTGRPFPSLDVSGDSENFYVEVELPGLKVEDLDIAVFGNQLTLKGSRAEEVKEGVTYYRRERGIGQFERLLKLPSELQSESVKAELNNGVLRITLPKAERAKPHKVNVDVVGQ